MLSGFLCRSLPILTFIFSPCARGQPSSCLLCPSPAAAPLALPSGSSPAPGRVPAGFQGGYKSKSGSKSESCCCEEEELLWAVGWAGLGVGSKGSHPHNTSHI